LLLVVHKISHQRRPQDTMNIINFNLYLGTPLTTMTLQA